MNAHTQSTRTAPAIRTPMPTPKRFLRCLACGTWKKERGYALCAECFRTNGTLPRAWFVRWMRQAERETEQCSFRRDPRFGKACRVYARRQQRRQALEAIEAALPKPGWSRTERRDRYADEAYDGLGSYELGDLLDWQMYDVPLPKPERSGHREMSEAEIAGWDARVDAWAAAHGLSLQDEPAPEIRPWGFWLEVDGARVWTDDPVLG
jgi:hypothetical protein